MTKWMQNPSKMAVFVPKWMSEKHAPPFWRDSQFEFGPVPALNCLIQFLINVPDVDKTSLVSVLWVFGSSLCSHLSCTGGSPLKTVVESYSWKVPYLNVSPCTFHGESLKGRNFATHPTQNIIGKLLRGSNQILTLHQSLHIISDSP